MAVTRQRRWCGAHASATQLVAGADGPVHLAGDGGTTTTTVGASG